MIMPQIFHRLVFDHQNIFPTLKIQKAHTVFVFDIMCGPLFITQGLPLNETIIVDGGIIIVYT